MRLKALDLGASDFLRKPVDPSELALRVRNTLAARAHREAVRKAFVRYVSPRLAESIMSEADAPFASAPPAGLIEVALGGAVVRVPREVDGRLLAKVLRALKALA